jgi:hypothetical protein
MYREVTMIELREVLRLWQEHLPKKRIAARLGLDPKTVRRYLWAAEAAGLRANAGAVSDEQLRDVLLALQPGGGRPRGDGWTRCSEQREAIKRWLADGLRLTKIRKLLARQGVLIGYPTLYRFAVEQLQFGRAATTIPSSMARLVRNCRWIRAGWVLAHAPADATEAPALPCLDLYRRPLALSVCVSHFRRNDGARD